MSRSKQASDSSNRESPPNAKPVSHSPLPWCIDDNGLIYGQSVGDDDEAPCIADVIADRDLAGFGIMSAEERANAAFIVTACNHHETLLATLRKALLALNTAPRFRVRSTDSYAIASEIDAVLAAAKGGAA